MWLKVNDYALYWDATHHTGTVLLELENDSQGKIRHLSKTELVALGDLFRNEPLVWYHSVRGDLSTEKHPVDDEEVV